MGKNKKKNRNKHKLHKDYSSAGGDGGGNEEESGINNDNITKEERHVFQKDTSSSNNNSNPLLIAQQEFIDHHMTAVERDYFFDNERVSPPRRAQLWMEQADVGESLVNNYSWATPTDTAMKVLRHFSPLVEVGCGSNAYWVRQLFEWDQRRRNQRHIIDDDDDDSKPIDIIAFDHDVEDGGKIPVSLSSSIKKNKKKEDAVTNGSSVSVNFTVQRGGPEVLSDPEIVEKNRTLFLCYPDDEDMEIQDEDGDDDGDNHNDSIQSFGWQCLDHYQGDVVIHVGELILDNNLSYDQAPWGRSSSPEFQQRLMSEYHCIYKISLPSWVHVRDTLTVWKRTKLCTMVFAAGEDDEDDNGGEEEVNYRHIPPDEILPINVAAPCMANLLPPLQPHSRGSDTTAVSKSASVPMKKTDARKGKHRKRQPSDEHLPASKHIRTYDHQDDDEKNGKDFDDHIDNKGTRGGGSDAYESPW